MIEPAIFNHKQAARYLVMSPVHLWRKRDEVHIPYVKMWDGNIAYSKKELDRWIESRMVRCREDAARLNDGRRTLNKKGFIVVALLPFLGLTLIALICLQADHAPKNKAGEVLAVQEAK